MQTQNIGCHNYLALSLAIASVCIFPSNYALAQITADETLPNNSIVKLEGNTSIITGGTSAASNLFHSFKDFSIPTGNAAYFNNAVNIENIITRVTGGSVSTIDGLIQVNGKANLYLINPNGIIFGKNASLNVPASFIATTANGIQFGSQGIFSVNNLDSPALLTVNPSAFLFNQIAAPIENNSADTAGLDPTKTRNAFGLRVPDGRSLLLVGGDITMNGGSLNAFGGRVELGSVSGTGSIGLSIRNEQLSLEFPDSLPRANVSITNKSRINVAASTSGGITINANSLNISGESQLLAGIAQGLGSKNSQALDINLNTTQAVKIENSSRIENIVNNNATGKSGNINIKTKEFSLSNGAGLFTIIYGNGSTGSTIIRSDRVSLDRGLIHSSVNQGAIGNGGNISITSENGNISVANGSSLNANTFGKGNAGNVTIEGNASISLDRSLVLSKVDLPASIGNGGNILIKGGNISLTNATRIDAGSNGGGNAGNIVISARDGIAINSLNNNGLLADINGRGNGGNIIIDAPTASVTIGNSQIFNRVLRNGVGNGGDIRIIARDLSLSNGAGLSTITDGSGSGGSVIINASDFVSLDGNRTAVLSAVSPNGGNKGGDIRIATRNLSLKNGAQLNASTNGKGNAGSVIIEAEANALFDSGRVFSSVGLGATGKGGSVSITSRNGDVSLTNGALIILSTGGSGNAGNAIVNARSLSLTNGSLLTASTVGSSNAGTINIKASELVSLSGANPVGRATTEISTDTLGTGNGNNITIETNAFRLSDGAIINARTTSSGSGGSIVIKSNIFEAINGGQLLTATAAGGQAGKIDVSAKERIAIAGIDPTFDVRKAKFGIDMANVDSASGMFANTAAGSTGKGGDIFVNSNILTVSDGGKIAVNSNGSGRAGSINLRGNLLSLNRKASITASTVTTDGGNIELNLQRLLQMRRESRISSSAGTEQTGDSGTIQASGDGGNITIQTPFIVALPQDNSDIQADSRDSRGGNVRIDAQSIIGAKFTEIASPQTSDITASGKLSSGTVIINTPDVDPTNGLIELPTNLVDRSQQLATSCNPNNRQRRSSFIVTGRSGLPSSPIQPLEDIPTLVNWMDQPEASTNTDASQLKPKTATTAVSPIVEAKGWVVDSLNNIQLVAQVPQISPQIQWFEVYSCPISK